MPITRARFVQGNFVTKKKVNKVRKEHPVAIFLKENLTRAFTVKEICKKVKMKENTVRSIIAEFKKKNLILHKTPYFMWKK